MTTPPQPRITRVQMTQPAFPAVHVCRYPVPAPRPFAETIVVPFPRQDPWLPGSLAMEELALPDAFSASKHPLLPKDLDLGVNPLWGTREGSPLLLPPDVLARRRLADEWGAATYLTLEDLGVGFPTEVVAQVAWWVLSQESSETLIRLLADLSWLMDAHSADPAELERLLGIMDAPAPIAGSLLAGVRSGRPLFHPRAVLWTLREMAAAEDADLAERRAWSPDLASDAGLLAHAYFSDVARSQRPTTRDLLLAVWLLQQAFHGFDDTSDMRLEDQLLSMTAALGFRFSRRGRWVGHLDQWLDTWMTPDDHPNVQGASPTPSQARAAYEQELGLPVDQWLAGIWALSTRWSLSITPGVDHPVQGFAADLYRLPFDPDPIEFSDVFIHAFETNCVTDLAAFRQTCRAEAGDQYAGLGSLPQSDSLATRNHPVLRFPDGRMTPLSLDLLAERAVDLHRILLGGRRAGTATGPLFEAYVTDLFHALDERFRVVDENELASATPEGHKHADLMVVHGADYLAVEMSVQTMPRGIAAGNLAKVASMAERYQAEADQASATLADLPAIAGSLGLPRPATVSFLVVTDTAVAHSPTLLRLLQNLRPGRPSKFLCTPDDVEHLVRLGKRGWSVPAAVASWQNSPAEVPLAHHLDNLTHITGVDLDDHEVERAAIDRWISLLPRRGEAPEAPAA